MRGEVWGGGGEGGRSEWFGLRASHGGGAGGRDTTRQGGLKRSVDERGQWGHSVPRLCPLTCRRRQRLDARRAKTRNLDEYATVGREKPPLSRRGPPRGQIGDGLIRAYRPLQARTTTAPNNSPWAENSAIAQRMKTTQFCPFHPSQETQVGIERTIRSGNLNKKNTAAAERGEMHTQKRVGGEGLASRRRATARWVRRPPPSLRFFQSAFGKKKSRTQGLQDNFYFVCRWTCRAPIQRGGRIGATPHSRIRPRQTGPPPRRRHGKKKLNRVLTRHYLLSSDDSRGAQRIDRQETHRGTVC